MRKTDYHIHPDYSIDAAPVTIRAYCAKAIERILSNYPFDFVLGAIHCVNHMNISSEQESTVFFQNNSLTDIRRDYFNTLATAVESGLFDSIAHIDLYLRYGFLHFGPTVSTVHRGVIEPIFTEMAQRGMGLEINTSSCRRGLKEFHPTKELIGLAATAGIKVFTVGSDAHALHELADNIDAALALLAAFKLSNHIFTQRQALPLQL